MKGKKYILWVFLFVFSLQLPAQNNAKLRKVKDQVQHPNTTATVNPDEVNETENDDANEKSTTVTDVVGVIVGMITYGILVETYWEKDTPMHSASLSAYPYVTDSIGNYVYDNYQNAARFRFEVKNSFLSGQNNLYGNDFQAKFRFFKRFGLQFNYLEYVEKLETGTEHLSLFSLMLNYHRIRTRRLDFWYGMGAMLVANGINKGGFALNLGAECFVARPVSIAAVYKNAFINRNSFPDMQLRLQYYHHKFVFSGGYRFVKLTNQKVNSYTLGMGYTF